MKRPDRLSPGKTQKPKGMFNRAAYCVATRENKHGLEFESTDFRKFFEIFFRMTRRDEEKIGCNFLALNFRFLS